MKEYVYNDIRVKFLSDDIVRLEVSSNGVFAIATLCLSQTKAPFTAKKPT